MTIEDVFDIPSFGGLVVVPGPLKTEWTGPLEMLATLQRPDGTTISATLKMQHVFQTPPPKEDRWACLLHGVEKEAVPLGTKVALA